MDRDRILNSYQSFVGRKKPEDVMQDMEKTLGTIEKASALSTLLDDIRMAYGMVTDSTTGRYKGLSKKTLALIAGGLAYLALPVDIVPDLIPVAGWLDDAVVLAWIFKQTSDEIARYKAWRATDIACDGQ